MRRIFGNFVSKFLYIGDSDVISSYHIYASCFSAML